VVNTAILGAFSKATGLVGLKAVLEGIKEYVPSKPEANVAAAEAAFKRADAK
jgi:pyruvate ferredoxin oxidoreductase gamma subunit/2-oxoisovalerate ferredoxin oxidoreductase gamma subunit